MSKESLGVWFGTQPITRSIESGELIETKEKDKNNESQAELEKSNNPGNQSNSNLFKGVKIIYNQIKEILVKYGFQEYSCIGEEFDPIWDKARSKFSKTGTKSNNRLA